MARRFGYQIQKIRPNPDNPINVFGLVVEDYLRRRGTDLTFVQVGANDGMTADPIRDYVRRHGWRGVLVEPQPALFERLVANYQGTGGLAFERAAVGPRTGTGTMYLLRDDPALPAWTRGVASFNKASVLGHRHQIEGIDRYLTSIEVPTFAFPDLLARHGLASFDLLQIDAEGYDFEIIRALDLAVHRPAIIQYEHFHLTADDQVECRQHLIRHGYALCSVIGDTVAYQP